jgi:CBS domain-containing protein
MPHPPDLRIERMHPDAASSRLAWRLLTRARRDLMEVAQICRRDVDTVAPDETALVAARRMRDRGVGTLIVVNDLDQPMGLLTDRDLAMRIVAQERNPARTPVTEVMTAMPTRVLETSSIDSALGNMIAGRCRRMPVVNGMGELRGVVSLDDILRHLAEEFSTAGELLDRESPHNRVA